MNASSTRVVAHPRWERKAKMGVRRGSLTGQSAPMLSSVVELRLEQPCGGGWALSRWRVNGGQAGVTPGQTQVPAVSVEAGQVGDKSTARATTRRCARVWDALCAKSALATAANEAERDWGVQKGGVRSSARQRGVAGYVRQ